MSREGSLILLGILAAFSPFLGLPYSWLMVILPILGILVAAIGVALRTHKLSRPAPKAQEFHETTIAS